MKNFKNLLFVASFFIVASVLGQTKISGTVVDETNQPLPGASVVVKGTTNGVVTDFDGKFMLNVKSNFGVIVVSYVGYRSKEIAFLSSKKNLGKIQLKENTNSLGEIVVTGKGVIDLAGGRKTPIAVSTIRAAEIKEKAGNWDLPEILKSTPSVQNIKGGGFGDGKMYLRGFDQTNVVYLLNGQPINGMEDGKMYWSNWSGVLDIANAVQVQRGLGASKIAIASVGGTVNIVTKTIDKKEGGFVQQMLANNNYTKTQVYYSTGESEKGWSFSAMLGHWQGDGYVNYTAGQGQTYFFSVGYHPNERNTFNFLITGAPQWHAAAGRGSIQDFLDHGIKYNSWNNQIESPNTISGPEGKRYPGGRNIYHKPVANLTWDYKINDNSSLSTVLYGSLGRGSFSMAMFNKAGVNLGYARGSVNNHDWFGLVSNYNNKLNDHLNLNLGADLRTYTGNHFRTVTEFFRGHNSLDQSSSFLGNYAITNAYGGISPWGAVFNPNTAHNQRLGYDYEEVISYYGAYGQLEYTNDKFSAFFQGSISNQSHDVTNYHSYAVETKAKNVTNLGYNLKAGAAYNITENHRLFANAGYYSRQPFHDNLFSNIRNSVDLYSPQVKNQEITGFEAGYQFKSEKVDVNLNVYHTTWANRTLPTNNGKNRETADYRYYQNRNLKEVHKGIELEVFTRPLENLKINGFLSLGDWKFVGNSTERTFNGDGDIVGTDKINKIDGFKVGSAAQQTAGVNGSYLIASRFSIDATWNWYNKLYSSGSLEKAPLLLPSYNTVDVGFSYKLPLPIGKNKEGSMQFRFNIDNLANEIYLESVAGNTPVSSTSKVYKGVDTSNNGRFGYGRTWNASVRLNF